ncbi:hypothetical protein [Micromonospora zamorensis]|uniref:hypothetical protein n=1 Tax=Micromonospora zamorensis TaxID=709883 RepID=UPI00081F9FD4|nr:hypothetical protein [Micromonospora zamorensis]SCG38265.1 hypothetical protein GA0070619_0626 [Micromonospora zamorensis]
MSKAYSFKVELFLGSLGWVDITADVRGSVTITRGRTSEGNQADPGRCTFRLDNISGNYSPRDPAGAYYGLLGRNTLLRVSAGRPPLTGRFYGEVVAWPPGWSLNGKDRYVDVEAAGVLRRLGQGQWPSKSALRRAIEDADDRPIAWWPLEDGRSVDRAASGVPGGPPIVELGRRSETSHIGVGDFDGQIVWGVEGSQGAASLVGLQTGGRLSASIPASTATSWTFEFAIRFDAGSNPGGNFSLPMTLRSSAGWDWAFMFDPAGTVTLVGGSTDASVIGVELVGPHPGWDGYLHHIRLDVEQDGGTSFHYLWVDGVVVATGPWSGFLAPVPDLVLPNFMLDSSGWAPSLGHLTLFAPRAAYYDSIRPGATAAWDNEAATDRLARLCGEEGISLTMSSVAADAVQRMGWQPVGTFAELLEQCVAVDGGYLHERRDALGLKYRPRVSLYNQTPVPIAYVGKLAPPFEPVDDADAVRNDVTVKRTSGSSARVVETTGRLAALPPPAGVGVYQSSVELNLANDAALADQAAWRVHLGTVDQPRYPALSVELAAPAWRNDLAGTSALLGVDSGDVIEVTGLPSWATGDARTLVLGYTETISEFTWRITFNGVPASPWDVATADGLQRAAADGSTLSAALTSTGMSLGLASTVWNGPWTTDPTDFPLDVRVGEERIRLSAISGGSSPQTATITARGLNGVQRAWPAGTEVDVWQPAIAPL